MSKHEAIKTFGSNLDINKSFKKIGYLEKFVKVAVRWSYMQRNQLIVKIVGEDRVWENIAHDVFCLNIC